MAVSSYVKQTADELNAAQWAHLQEIPSRHDADARDRARMGKKTGKGKLRYDLRRLGLIRMSRPDGKGKFWVHRTSFGDEVTEYRWGR